MWCMEVNCITKPAVLYVWASLCVAVVLHYARLPCVKGEDDVLLYTHPDKEKKNASVCHISPTSKFWSTINSGGL